MPLWVRSIIGILAGAAVTALIIFGMELLNAVFFPPPPGLDFTDPEQVRAHAETLPGTAFILVLVGWGLGTLAGTFVAAKIAGRKQLVIAMVVGLLFLFAALVNMAMIPHPQWMWIAGILVFPGAAFVGARLAMKGTQT